MTNKTYKGLPKPANKSGMFFESHRHKLQARGIHTGHLADRPEPGKIYALTGGSEQPSISKGNTWAESEVKRPIWEKKDLPTIPKEQEEKREDLELKDIGQFSGSEEYHKINPFNPNQKGTDGIRYLEENGYGWFVSDMAVAIGMKPNLRNEEFLSIKLKVNPDKSALATIDDGNGHVLYKQEYQYTDAKKDLKLFYRDNVMMLPGEY